MMEFLVGFLRSLGAISKTSASTSLEGGAREFTHLLASIL
jgi:hypothetical protein